MDKPRVNLKCQTEEKLTTKTSDRIGKVKTDVTKIENKKLFETSDSKKKTYKNQKKWLNFQTHGIQIYALPKLN